MATLTRADIIRFIEEQAELPRSVAMVAVETVLTSIVNTILAGEKVEFRRFGSFRVREHRARLGRNPRTGEPVNVRAKRVVYFTPGKEMRARVNASSP
jgi:integration host factor subunit beta